jgi:hypothetical protein
MVDLVITGPASDGPIKAGRRIASSASSARPTAIWKCARHRCTPLAPGSIVKVHAIISAALSLAVRYEWIDRNRPICPWMASRVAGWKTVTSNFSVLLPGMVRVWRYLIPIPTGPADVLLVCSIA